MKKFEKNFCNLSQKSYFDDGPNCDIKRTLNKKTVSALDENSNMPFLRNEFLKSLEDFLKGSKNLIKMSAFLDTEIKNSV